MAGYGRIYGSPERTRAWETYHQKNQRGGGGRQEPQGSRDLTQDVMSGNIGGILDEQLQRSDTTRDLALQDRDAAVNELRSYYNKLSAGGQLSGIREQLGQSFHDSPFAKTLKASIEETLKNPDVYSGQQIEQFTARANEMSSAAIRDAIDAANVSNAQRGVQGGIAQGMEQQFRLQAGAEAIRNRREIEMEAASARADNLRQAQNIGANFEIGLSQADAQRMGILADVEMQNMAQQFDVVSQIARIFSETEYEADDLSGFASIAADIAQAERDMAIQVENLSLLREQIASQERLGIADIQLRTQYNSQVNALNREVERLRRQLQDREDDN